MKPSDIRVAPYITDWARAEPPVVRERMADSAPHPGQHRGTTAQGSDPCAICPPCYLQGYILRWEMREGSVGDYRCPLRRKERTGGDFRAVQTQRGLTMRPTRGVAEGMLERRCLRQREYFRPDGQGYDECWHERQLLVGHGRQQYQQWHELELQQWQPERELQFQAQRVLRSPLPRGNQSPAGGIFFSE